MRNLTIRWRVTKRLTSSISYSTLPLTGAKATIGDLLLVALKMPPSRQG